jgi:hypothetical protein
MLALLSSPDKEHHCKKCDNSFFLGRTEDNTFQILMLYVIMETDPASEIVSCNRGKRQWKKLSRLLLFYIFYMFNFNYLTLKNFPTFQQ